MLHSLLFFYSWSHEYNGSIMLPCIVSCIFLAGMDTKHCTRWIFPTWDLEVKQSVSPGPKLKGVLLHKAAFFNILNTYSITDMPTNTQTQLWNDDNFSCIVHCFKWTTKINLVKPYMTIIGTHYLTCNYDKTYSYLAKRIHSASHTWQLVTKWTPVSTSAAARNSRNVCPCVPVQNICRQSTRNAD